MSIGEPPPACPESLTDVIAFPSICFTFGAVAVVAFFFACLTVFKYNTVSLWSKDVHSDIISNTPWVAYFLAVTLRSAFICVQYAFEQSNSVAVVFNALALLARGLVVFCLTFALHHQYKFRTSPESRPITTSDPYAKEDRDAKMTLSATVGGYVSSANTKKPFLRRFRSLKRYFGILELIFVVFLAVYLCLGITVLFVENNFTETAYLTMYCLQQIPAIVLVVLILMKKKSTTGVQERGLTPSLRSKVFLAIAGACALIDELPITGWGRILPDNCVFYVASWDDLTHSIYGLSLVFFFLFLRSEYLRNVEQCIWKTVTSMQDRLSFEDD